MASTINNQKMAQDKFLNKRTLFNCSNKIEKYECQICPKYQTYLLTSLTTHTKDAHANKSMEVEDYMKYLIIEHNVSGEFETKKNVGRNNEQFLTGGNWSVCEQCPYKCKSKSHMRRHVLSNHTAPESIQWIVCEHCPSKFKRKEYLRRHTLSCHTNPEYIQWFDCVQCPSKFKRKEHLKKHILSCHTDPEGIQWIECEQCPSKFKRKEHLKKHVLFCHTKSECSKNFGCEYCESKFKQKQHLKRHMLCCHKKPDSIGS